MRYKQVVQGLFRGGWITLFAAAAVLAYFPWFCCPCPSVNEIIATDHEAQQCCAEAPRTLQILVAIREGWSPSATGVLIKTKRNNNNNNNSNKNSNTKTHFLFHIPHTTVSETAIQPSVARKVTHIIQHSMVSANKSAISAWVLRRAPKPCHHAIPSTQSSAKRRLSAPVIQSPSSVIKSLAFTAAAASTILSVMFNDSLVIHSVARCQKSECYIYIFYICTCVYIIYLYTYHFMILYTHYV